MKKKLIKIIASMSFLLTLTVAFNASSYVYASSSLTNYNVRAGDVDFGQDKDRAEKWADSEFERWSKEITKDEKISIDRLYNPTKYDLNLLLRLTGGDLSLFPEDMSQEEKDNISKDIKNIDRALKYKDAKLSENVYVYKNMDLDELDLDKLDIMQNGKIDREIVSDLKEGLKNGVISEYLIGSLSDYAGSKDQLVKWHILLPRGTNAGLVDTSTVVLNRDNGLEITDIKIVTQKGKEYIKIDAKLVAKEEVDKKIKAEEDKVNQKLNELMGFPEAKKMIELRASSEIASYSYLNVYNFIEKLIEAVDITEIEKVFNFMSSYGGKIIITDKSPATLEESYYPNTPTGDKLNEIDSLAGLYNRDNKVLIIAGNRIIENGFEGGLSINATLIHEFGHALDNFAGSKYEVENNEKEMSQTTDFLDIFNDEGEKLTSYGSENSSEFFAEAFRLMHTGSEKFVKNNAPRTYKYIKDVEEKII